MKIKNIIILSMIILFLILLKINYDKIPSRINHINRNQYNQFPIGKLSLIKDDEFIDESGIYFSDDWHWGFETPGVGFAGAAGVVVVEY